MTNRRFLRLGVYFLIRLQCCEEDSVFFGTIEVVIVPFFIALRPLSYFQRDLVSLKAVFRCLSISRNVADSHGTFVGSITYS